LPSLKETQEIEAQGSLLLPDGSRRRTSGGVFFYLVRTKGPKPVRFLFWQRKQGQAAASPQSPPPAFTWANWIAVLDEIGVAKGAASTVKITVIGRPGKIIDLGTCVVTSLQSSKVPSLPKGVPTPPIAVTTYTLYIATKQWRRVADAMKDQEDALIVEGFPQLDAQTGSIAVFATNTTTRKLQQAQRQTQPAQAASGGQ
jgi:hypothetical protein